MILEFLAFRFEGVRRTDEILAKPADVGWKCRKYIKWREIHNDPSDAKALYAFADDLLERSHLNLNLYGRISGVCCNVQRWRLDKEKMSVDPPLRKEWASRAMLFAAARTKPALIKVRLLDQKLKAENLSSLTSQIVFYASELDSLFRSQNIKSYPFQPLAESLLSTKESDFQERLCARFKYAYDSVGLDVPKCGNAPLLLQRVLDDLGFAEIILEADLLIPAGTFSSVQGDFVELVSLEKFKLLEVAFAGGIKQIRLNQNHPFIKSILVANKISPEMEMFFKSYGSCMLNMAGALDTLETFNSYLGIELHGQLSRTP